MNLRLMRMHQLEKVLTAILGKVCFKCGEEKPLESFSLHKKMKDGHLGKCKSCACAYSKQHREDNPEHYREFERKRIQDPERRRKSSEMIKAYEEKYPQRKIANWKLNSAVKQGLVIQEPCFVCGEKAVAHHADYDQPLLVTWLCHKHHRQLHKEFNAALGR